MDLLSEIHVGLSLASTLAEHHAKAQHALAVATDALNRAEKIAGDSVHSDDSKRAALALLRGAAIEAIDRYVSSLHTANDTAGKLSSHVNAHRGSDGAGQS